MDKGKYFPKNKQGGEKILANELRPKESDDGNKKVNKLIPDKPDEASGMPKGEGRVRPSQKWNNNVKFLLFYPVSKNDCREISLWYNNAMKKIVKKIKTKKKAEITPNQFGVILEDVNSKFDLLMEGFSGLSGQVEDLDKKFNNLDTKFDKLDTKVDKLDAKVDSNHIETNNNFKAVFEYLSKIDDEIQSMKLEIEGLKNELSRKADLDKLLQLEKRIIILEKRVCSLSQSN